MIRLVVDTNIILSALIKSRKIKNIILKKDNIVKLYTPAYAYFEILSHYNKILKHTTLSENDIWFILTEILPRHIRVCGEYLYYNKLKEAFQIAKQFDEKDTPFIALSLKLDAPIWTGDKNMIIHSLRTGKYIALGTQAVEDLLKGKSIEEIKEDLKKRYLTE